MNTIKVTTRPFLMTFVIELIEVNAIGEESSRMFECLAESYAHALEQALNAYPNTESFRLVKAI